MATTSATSASGSISGIISGMDTDTIISKLVAFAQKPIALLQDQQAAAMAKLTAWQGINTRLLALKIKSYALSTPASFQSKTATVSDDTALLATTSSDAAAGSYTITVNRLAEAQKQQSQGYLDINSTTVGTGTVTVGVGEAAKSITLDATNNTLSGLRDAINRAGAGVSATITDLGSLNTHDYHLVLTSNTTGEANTIAWTPSLSGGTAPTWTTTTAASNSSITIGTGASASTVTKATNTITDVITGMTLTLKTADVSKPLTVNVSANTSDLVKNVNDFVDQYNSVVSAISAQFAYDPTTQQAGVLMGDYTLQNIQSDLGGIMNVVPGLSGDANNLSQMGFSMQSDGTLAVDQAAFSQALATNPNGVMSIFAGVGQSSDQSIQYLGHTDNTLENGGATPYKVRIDRLATQSQTTAGVAQTSALAADETLTINGTAILLTAGMTGQQVADKINTYSDTTGVKASRTSADGTGSGNFLTLTQSNYGSGGHITAVSSQSNGGAAPATGTTGIGNTVTTESNGAGETGSGLGTKGLDITGAFGVTENGITTWEAATGSGQMLTGAAGNAHTDGLSVLSIGTTTGEHGSISLTRGVTASFNKMLGFLTGATGGVATAESALNSNIADLKATVLTQQERVTAYSDQIRTEFNNMESKLAELQGQGNYLTSQFASLNNAKSS